MKRATVFAPGSIGNVGPGFDVLGLAVDGIGDRVTVELTDGAAEVRGVTGVDADLSPREPSRNVASIAAQAWLRGAGIASKTIVSMEKGLRLAGGLGGSAASSVAGAYAAALAAGAKPATDDIITAALEGEATVAGRHLDNIAPSVCGGLTLVRSIEPLDIVRVRGPQNWMVVLVTPDVRIETKAARALLPDTWERSSWTQQMANTAALLHAFATGDAALARRSLSDAYAEPRRAALIPRFHETKQAALEAGAIGCSISGSGPTIFALVMAGDAERCRDAMQDAMADVRCEIRVARIATEGARPV
jgi:homoserine kinase